VTLRRRLFATTAAAVVVAVAVSLLIAGALTRHALKDTISSNLDHQADLVRDRLATGLAPPARFLRLRPAARQPRVAVLTPAQAATLLPAPARTALTAGGAASGSATVRRRSVFFAARTIPAGVLVVYRSTALQRQDWGPYLDSFLIAGLVGAVIAAAVSLLLARRISRPVMRVAAASRRLAAHSSPEPVPVEGPAELATLAASFNQMHAELDAARDAERAFLLSVSHELKTPLTAIRGYVEGMSDGAVAVADGAAVIDREAVRLERLVRDLLDLARLDQRAFAIEREPLDLATCSREVAQRYERQARDFGIALRVAGADTAPASGDPDRILQALSNLVENALRVTPVAGRVTIDARRGLVSVADTGPGLEPEDAARAFERFYLHRRIGHQHAVGTGLGLAIVKELAEAMGGTASVVSEPGQGARFELRLPDA
jgi:two-component system OmpR family sensor kinase